jgi:hypothetical protein
VAPASQRVTIHFNGTRGFCFIPGATVQLIQH